jgi:hypothetical protein
MKIAYSQLPAKPDAVFPNRQSVGRPIAPLLLEKHGKMLSVLAIVDSGADICLIPNPLAYVFSGTTNHPQIAYFDKIKVTILDLLDSQQSISFDLNAGFCDTLEHVGLGLLGQEGFFSRFDVCFHQTESYFEIKGA